jgi:hypothetical protein
MRRCPECGFDSQAFDPESTAAMVRANAASWAAVLLRPDAASRPDESTWSPLEYACHVRDVFRIYDDRLRLMLSETDPLFANWDQDETALAEKYWEQDPDVVERELREERDRLLADFGTVDGEEWQRPGRRTDGSLFTIDSLARYMAHDAIHHAWDVTEGPAAA